MTNNFSSRCHDSRSQYIIRIIMLFLAVQMFAEVCARADSPTRAISLAPVITEVFVELGLENNLIATTTYCKLPPLESEPTKISLGTEINQEFLLLLKPSAIFTLLSQTSLSIKENKNLAIYHLSNETISEIENMISTIGNHFNKSEEAKRLISKKRSELQDIILSSREHFPANLTATFLFHDGNTQNARSFYTAGANTFYQELFSLLKIKNIFDTHTGYLPISYEALLELKPNIIFFSPEGNSKEKLKQVLSPEFKSLGISLHFLPKDPVLFPGIKYPKIYNAFSDSIINEISKSAETH